MVDLFDLCCPCDGREIGTALSARQKVEANGPAAVWIPNARIIYADIEHWDGCSAGDAEPRLRDHGRNSWRENKARSRTTVLVAGIAYGSIKNDGSLTFIVPQNGQ